MWMEVNGKLVILIEGEETLDSWKVVRGDNVMLGNHLSSVLYDL